MDRDLILRLTTAQEMFLNDFARCGSSFGSKEADASWVKLSLVINEIVSASKSFTDSGVSFRQDLVKAIAPVVLANLYDSAKYSDNEVAVYAKMRTDEIVNSLMED